MENKIIKAGTKIVIGTDAGMVGTDNMTAYILTKDYTDNMLGDIAWQEGLQWAESYGVYPTDDSMSDEEMEESGYEYNDNIEGWWELYDEEEHEGKCSFGNGVSFKEL